LPLLPLQILWINLITDSSPAFALGVEQADEGIMRRRTIDKQNEGILKGILGFIIIAGITSLLAMMAIFYWEYFLLNESLEKTRTMVMLTSIMFQVLFVFTCRSDKSIFKIGLFSNKWVVFSVILSVLLQFLLLYTPLSSAFGLVPLTAMDWLKVTALGSSGLILFEAYKLIKRS